MKIYYGIVLIIGTLILFVINRLLEKFNKKS